MKTWLLALACWHPRDGYSFRNVAIKAPTPVLAWREWIRMHEERDEVYRYLAQATMIGSWELTEDEVVLEEKESW